MSKAQILIAEDDAIVALDIESRLRNLGYSVSEIVSSGEEAIKKVQENKPDLVLMDIILKGEMDGIEAADPIHSQFNIPVVYLTAYADEKILERAKSTEPFGYIIKPFDDRELHSAIEIALYKHKAEKALQKAHDELERKVEERTAELEAEITEHKQDERSLQQSNKLLDALSRAQSSFISEIDSRVLFNELLSNLLSLTQSEYGFIGEVLYLSSGDPYLKTHAITNIAWDEQTTEFYEKNAPKGMEFHNLKTLFGAVMTTAKPVIANDPSIDPRRGGIPEGHPALKAFLGLPFFSGKTMVGIVGIANRPNGYDDELIEFLQPFVHTCGNIIESYRNDQRRREAAQQLQKSKTMLQGVFDGILEPLIMLDKDMQIKVLNKAAKQYYQISEYHEVVGCRCYEVFRGRSSPCEACEIPAAILVGDAINFRRKGFMNPGRLEQLFVYPLKGDDDKTSAAIIHISDITEATLMQKQLLQSEKLASVGELAAGLAHEINNPINGVINYAQILIDDAKDQAYGAGIPDKILKEAERIASIVKNLLSFARETEDKPRPAAVHNIIADALELVDKQINKDGIRLGVDVPDDLPAVNVNSQKIQQVIMNLLSNARYALNQKYPGFHKNKLLQIEGEILEAAGRKFSRITIHDKGAGIPAEIIDKICDPFFSTKPQGKGTGLGLSISYGIVRDHGGRLSFESKEGEYTKAIVDLPAVIIIDD